MTDKQKIQILEKAFTNTIWMAIRYADGRHTYAPDTVRTAVKDFQKVFPGWKPRKDIAIGPPKETEFKGISFKSDYLHDLLEDGD
jgi:hypothetical protein